MVEDNQIDRLLERYLELLDTYTSLRASLSELQSSVYQSLARANFSAERGVRYGQDFYDERMQATKTVIAEEDADEVPKFDLLDLNAAPAPEEHGTEDVEENAESPELDGGEKDDVHEKGGKGQEEETDNAPTSETSNKPKSKDPLRWFGILSPPALREAQNSASRLVQTAVNIASVDAEMKSVEIEIRRARKRKAKGEKIAGAVKKEEDGTKAEDDAKTEDDELDGVKQEARVEEQTAKVNRGGGCGRVAI